MRRSVHVVCAVASLMLLVSPAVSQPGHKVVQRTRPATWSSTTIEAAATPENQAALQDGHMAQVEGEVIDVSCFVQLGKRGAGHIPCGTKCIQHGEPIGVVDAQGTVYLLMAEQHHPRRDGQADIRAAFLPSLGKTVTVEGALSERGGTKVLFVSVPVDTTSVGK